MFLKLWMDVFTKSNRGNRLTEMIGFPPHGSAHSLNFLQIVRYRFGVRFGLKTEPNQTEPNSSYIYQMY
ncbi:hypothetical protein GBA52_005478 [Prunus armeniaca]|nr:hypothetical protein GBA52_005478 [Prunus armeniaca]